MSAPRKLKIYKYIFSLLALMLFSQTAICQHTKHKKAPVKKEVKKKAAPKKEEPQPLLRSVTLQADVAAPLLASSGIKTAEASVDVNLRNKWFPVWEFGYASVDHSANEGAQFTTHGIFNRIGVNVNMLKAGDNKSLVQYIFYVGLRLGFSSFNYDINNITLTDPYWKTSQITDIQNIKASARWGEIVAGIRLNVFKNVSVGWSGRLKVGLSTGKGDYSPWYVPGYGIKDGSGWGFTYTVGYTIPIKK